MTRTQHLCLAALLAAPFVLTAPALAQQVAVDPQQSPPILPRKPDPRPQPPKGNTGTVPPQQGGDPVPRQPRDPRPQNPDPRPMGKPEKGKPEKGKPEKGKPEKPDPRPMNQQAGKGAATGEAREPEDERAGKRLPEDERARRSNDRPERQGAERGRRP